MKTRTYLWRLFTARWGLAVLVFLLWVGYATVPLLFGLILRAFFDTLTGEAPAGFFGGYSVWTLIAFFLANRLAMQLLEIAAAGTSAYQFVVLQALLQRNLFRTIMEAAGFTPPHGSGETLNRFEEDTEAALQPVWHVTYGSSYIVSTALTLVIMLRINVPLTVVALLPMVVTIFIVQRLGDRIGRYREAARAASGAVSGLLTDLLHGVTAVQVAGAEHSVIQRFDRLSAQRRDTTVRDETFSALVHALNGTAVSVATGLILLFAAQMMRAGSFTVGDFALFVSYISLGGGSIGELIGAVGRQLESTRQAQVSFTRLGELVPAGEREKLVATDALHLRGELPALPTQAKRASDRLRELRVRGLSHTHADNEVGIEDVDLTVRRGEFVVITGRVGSGKSVLIETLLGLRPRSGGEIRWNGQIVADPAAFFVPPRVAYTSQVPRLFSDTLRDNILMGLPEDGDNLNAAIRAAVLEDDIAQLEAGLDTVVGPRGVKLSGGQMGRTAAARMFVRRAELLVFDDLSSALDVETERLLWERLFTQPDPPACLVVSHRRAALQRAGRILLLEAGRVVDTGTLDELLARSAVMGQLWQGAVR